MKQKQDTRSTLATYMTTNKIAYNKRNIQDI
jgi:hypothetical protein